MDPKIRVEGRGRTFRLRPLMVTVALIAVGLSGTTHLYRGFRRDQEAGRRNQEASTRMFAWIDRLQADHPALKGGTTSMDIRDDYWAGHDWDYRACYETPTGHPITVSARTRSRPSRDPGRVVISAEGRSVTWPIEDVERGRPIDLRAEFPGAFR